MVGDKLSKKTTFRKGTGVTIASLSLLWVGVAPWLSANLFISVWIELASYWFALLAFLIGCGLWIADGRPIGFGRSFYRELSAAICLGLLVANWRMSDAEFAFWKLRAIPPSLWSKMSQDLITSGQRLAESGENVFTKHAVLPNSLWQLGRKEDFKGGVANIWNSTEYRGVFAIITFGYKTRSWGLLCGPEERAMDYSRGGHYFQVGTNAFFFIGSRG